MTDVSRAEALILEQMQMLPSAQFPINKVIGSVLREDVLAERDHPPFDRVTMDGIAIKYVDWEQGLRCYRVVGSQGAGVRPLSIIKDAECIKIMTGAMLPDGADTVIPVERLTSDKNNILVEDTAKALKGQYIHPSGSDRIAGSQLLSSGQLIGPPEMAILASSGNASVQASIPPRVAIISTGDELIDVGEEILPYQIRSSNDRAIEASLIRHCQATVTRVCLKDDPTIIQKTIKELHDKNDTVILSGGVSMGDYDFVPQALKNLSAKTIFHRIEQKPGRPMWFGVSEDRKPIFGLPGNPVSTLVCLTRYVIPALKHAMGLKITSQETVRLTKEILFKADLTYFLPVELSSDENGVALAKPRTTNTSGDFVSLANTEGFVELPRGQDRFSEGTSARLFRW